MAEIAAGWLEQNGIPCLLKSTVETGLFGASGANPLVAFDLFVNEEDAERAGLALADFLPQKDRDG